VLQGQSLPQWRGHQSLRLVIQSSTATKVRTASLNQLPEDGSRGIDDENLDVTPDHCVVPYATRGHRAGRGCLNAGHVCDAERRC